MSTKAEFIHWAIQRYKGSGGAGIPSQSASSLTTSKVQVRDVDGELLEEYDRDFAEYILGESDSRQPVPQRPPNNDSEPIRNKNNIKSDVSDQQSNPKANPTKGNKNKELLIAALGILVISATMIGLSRQTNEPGVSTPQTVDITQNSTDFKSNDARNGQPLVTEPTITASPENTFENSCNGLEQYFNTRSNEFPHYTVASGFKNSEFNDGVANAKATQAFMEKELGKGPNTHLFGGDGIPLYFCEKGTISVYGPSFLKVCDSATIRWKQGEGLKWSAPKCETMPPQPVPE